MIQSRTVLFLFTHLLVSLIGYCMSVLLKREKSNNCKESSSHRSLLVKVTMGAQIKSPPNLSKLHVQYIPIPLK